jgi:hypothetical protein
VLETWGGSGTRSLGPVLAGGPSESIWICMVGPILGAVTVVIVYAGHGRYSEAEAEKAEGDSTKMRRSVRAPRRPTVPLEAHFADLKTAPTCGDASYLQERPQFWNSKFGLRNHMPSVISPTRREPFLHTFSRRFHRKPERTSRPRRSRWIYAEKRGQWLLPGGDLDTNAATGGRIRHRRLRTPSAYLGTSPLPLERASDQHRMALSDVLLFVYLSFSRGRCLVQRVELVAYRVGCSLDVAGCEQVEQGTAKYGQHGSPVCLSGGGVAFGGGLNAG